MGRVGALMFGAAAVVTVAGLALPHQRVDETGLAAVAVGAAIAAVTLAVGGERLPVWCYVVACACGTAVVSLSLFYNGERYGGAAGNDEMFYLWVAIYAAYFFGRAMTALQLGLIAAAYAVTLVAIHPGDVGVSRWISTTGLILGAAAIVRLLSERIGKLLGELADAARTDHLTGLPNRRAFEEAIQHELARVERGGPGFAVLVGDLDSFKEINDRFGHGIGDRVLVDAGTALQLGARSTDLVTRLGGDEFALLLPQTDLEGAQELGARLAQGLCERSSATGFSVGLSVGAAQYGADGHSLDELLRAADGRLYAEKRARAQARAPLGARRRARRASADDPVGRAQTVQQREHGRFDRAPLGLGIVRVSDHHRGLAERAEQQMRQRAHVLASQRARVHRSLQPGGDEPEAVAGVDLTPLGPAEHGRGVEQGDLREGGVGAGVEEAAHARDQQLERIRDVSRIHVGGDRGHHLGLELLVDRAEQVALVLEVVIERAAGHLCAAHDLLGADRGVSTFGEQRPRGGQERGARRLRSPSPLAARLHGANLPARGWVQRSAGDGRRRSVVPSRSRER